MRVCLCEATDGTRLGGRDDAAVTRVTVGAVRVAAALLDGGAGGGAIDATLSAALPLEGTKGAGSWEVSMASIPRLDLVDRKDSWSDSDDRRDIASSRAASF